MGSINYGIGRRYFSFYFKANSFTMVTFKSTFQEKCSCSMFIGLLKINVENYSCVYYLTVLCYISIYIFIYYVFSVYSNQIC